MREYQLFLATSNSVAWFAAVHRSKLHNFLPNSLDRMHNIDFCWCLCANNANFSPYCNPNRFYYTETMALFEDAIPPVAVFCHESVLKCAKTVIAECSSFKCVEHLKCAIRSSLVQIPQPIWVSWVVGFKSFISVSRHAGRIVALKPICRASLINAMSFFLYDIEWYGCRIISYLKKKRLMNLENLFVLIYLIFVIVTFIGMSTASASDSDNYSSLNKTYKSNLFKL